MDVVSRIMDEANAITLESPVADRLTQTLCVYTVQAMRTLIISSGILEKLRDKHSVERREVEQCFENKVGTFLIDDREDHRTDPETLWFIAPTNTNRLLKIAFMFIDGNIHIKSAFDPNKKEIEIYEELGK